MAAAASFQRLPHSTIPLDLGSDPYSTASSYKTPGIDTFARKKLSLSTSLGGHASRASPSKQKSSLCHIDTDMTSHTTTIPAGTATRTHAKLHKRNSSGNSIPASPSPLSGSYPQFATPYATQEEPFPFISSHQPTPPSSTPKIKPYIRKLSSKDATTNQGALDLSKSTAENGSTLAGLGINDFVGQRSASDVTFSHSSTGRRTPHMRTASVNSTISTGSGSYKPSQPFIHPMRQTPSASYTSYASSLANSEEARESSDIVLDDDFQLGHGFRTRRSVSISSTPQQNAPTPLSQSHTAADLWPAPNPASSSRSKLASQNGRKRSADLSRPSSDRAYSLLSTSRKSDPEQSVDDRISALRKNFAEKEASKSQKREKEETKRRESDLAKEARREERQRRKSEADDRKPGNDGGERRRVGVQARSYESMRPGRITALEGRRYEEKGARVDEPVETQPEGGWHRFVRAMSCGG
ncbi:uncharacterized protein LTR77_010466 [Saxophila tyrrhenica]|uniref:Uncharacterized protein n=1 Tax=Saxophila tyrrhenica TaxID=1690608 RepID=A0AAV9NVS3_9PEZI|nr:hypothetical protein LTR77_010466 [Saxophila tyrrhenica]